MALVTEVLRNSPLDFLDLLIVTAVSDANNKPLPGTDVRGETRGISRNAVSRRLNVPLETVRRRVAALIKQNILREQPDGLVFQSRQRRGAGRERGNGHDELQDASATFRELKSHGVPLD